MEYLAWSDKEAIDQGRPITNKRKWKTTWNETTVKTATSLLESDLLTPGTFLHRTSYSILAAVKHGLRLRNSNEDADEDADEEQ